jgi:hypothetical protein
VSEVAGSQECIQLRLPHSNTPLAYTHSAQFAAVDHVSHRLLVELQHLGDLGHG